MNIRGVLALNIRKLRRARGLSQEALAHDTEIDRTYISALEREVYSASIDIVDKLANVLGLDAWLQFWRKHGRTPSQYRAMARDKTATIDAFALKEAGRLPHAIAKYAGGAEAANSTLGILIDPAYRWPRDRIVEELRRAVERWGASPHQIVYEHRTNKKVVELVEFRRLGQLIDAASRSGGLTSSTRR